MTALSHRRPAPLRKRQKTRGAGPGAARMMIFGTIEAID